MECGHQMKGIFFCETNISETNIDKTEKSALSKLKINLWLLSIHNVHKLRRTYSPAKKPAYNHRSFPIDANPRKTAAVNMSFQMSPALLPIHPSRI